MKNKFLCLLMYLLKVNRKAIYLFFFFCNLAILPVFAEETVIEPKYITCNDVSIIESFASDDYKLEKGRGGNKTTEDIEGVNSQYINYINFPYNEANIDYLFQPLRIKNINDKIEGTFLTCGIEVGDIICDSERLISEDGKTCKTTFNRGSGENIETIRIINCATYSENTNTGNEKSCYPESHICNKYKNDALNKYYSIVKKSNDINKKEFYIFEKIIIKEKINKNGKELRQNCNFEVLPCDYKIVNESNNTSYKPSGFTDDGYVNVVFNNAGNSNNQKFINNIFGNIGDNMLFVNPNNTESNSFPVDSIKTSNCNASKYKEANKRYSDCNKSCFDKIEGTSEYTNCKMNCENEYDSNYRIPCKNDFIMRSPYYFKYIVYNNVNKDVYYFVKNINAATFGKVCNGYLPNCKYIYPDDGLNVLYNNTIIKEGGNNIISRSTFYGNNKDVKEEYLWYIGEQNISNKKCLSITSNDDKLPNYDIGYCSDLTDDGSDLKYKDGLESGYIEEGTECNSEDSDCIRIGENNKKFKFKAPNCYLKSCADLTTEELEKIIGIGNKQAKYCSEYYWLEDKYGMKYFPKENPVYCSDLENIYIEDSNNNVSVISETEYNKVNNNSGGNKKIISQLKFRDEDFEIRKHNYINKKKDCKLEKKTEVFELENLDGSTNKVESTYTDYDCSGVVPEERYYSYGGGINKRKSNCYLKSCFSMTADERNRVVNANMLNISKELNRIKKETETKKEECKNKMKEKGYNIDDENNEINCEGEGCECLNKDYMKKQIDISLFEKENLPVYCDDTFMISSRFNSDETKFDDLNLNVIPCYELSKIINSSDIVDSNDLIGNYNTNTSYVLCRNNYTSSFNSENIFDNVLKEDEGSILNSVFSYSEENKKFSENYKNSSSNHTFSNSEYYIKTKYNSADYGDPKTDSLEIEKYKNICQNLDNNILYYNARIPGVNLNGGLDNDYFDTDLITNLTTLNNNGGDINDEDTDDNSTKKENDKEKFLEEYVYKCKNYKSKYNKSSAIIIDCGLYHDFDASGKTESLGNDIISTMDEDVKSFLKTICMFEIEDKKPDDREILTNAVDSRGTLRSDEYNWLLKPIPLKDYTSESKNKYINYKSKSKNVPSTTLKVSNGCAFFENYDDDAVNKVAGTKMASAIPLNKTNYISTTNFSDPLRRRKEDEKCNVLEPYCTKDITETENGKVGYISKSTDAYTLDQKMEKCQVGIDEKGEPKMKRCSVTVCSRYPNSVSNKNLNMCGAREGSKYRDKCLEVPINGDKDEKIVYLSKTSGNNSNLNSFLNFGKKSDRLRTKIVDDKILVFRDAFVDYNSNSNIAGTPHFEDKLEKKCGNPATEEEIKNDPEKVYEGLCLEKDFYFPKGNTEKSSDYWTTANAIGLETELYNIRNKKFIYFDADQYYQRHIAAKGSTYGSLGAIYISGCGLTAAGCMIARIFNKKLPTKEQCYHTCVAEALYQTADLTVKDYRGKFIYYMNSSRNHILDYFDITKLPYEPANSNYIPDSGLVIGGNIIDNNNYLYMYYPRYDTIERDIRSKLESNINVNGERFYHNTVLAKDIIRACKLERFVGDRDTNKSKNGRQHKSGEMNYYESANYEFVYYKLDKDGNQIAECWESNIENCLDPEILRCLKSYDVSFIKHNFNNDDVSDDFIMRKGKHLKKYNDCDNLEIFGSCSRDSGEYNQYIPTNIVAYTGNKYSNEELKTRDDCKLDEYGKPLGDLSRCRGFEDDTNGNNLFYTETQSVPVPLYTHPFLFYTLITPKNTPELFDPTFILSQYYKFSDYYKENNILGIPKDIEKVNDIITDFFYPAFKFSYDFVNGTNDSNYDNKFKNRNNFVSRVEAKNKRSYPYIVEYSSNNIPNAAPFKYILDKTYDIDKKGCYTPKVCIYEIAIVDRAINEELGVCATNIPEYKDIGTGDIKDSEKDASEQIIKLAVGSNNKPTECIKIVDTGVGCYERNIPYLDKFILKLDKDSLIYNTPYINAYLIPNDPNKMNFNYITNEAKEDYIMRENNKSSIIEIDNSFENKSIEDRVVKRAYSEKQGFGLNFERSYCSQMYFDYYTSLDSIQREETKRDKKDNALINRLKTKISTINTIIKPECDKENGEEGEYIIDEGVSSRDIALSNEEKEDGKKQCKKIKDECVKECGENNSEKCKAKCVEDYNKCEKKYTSNEIISRKTTIVKKYNESYGGFNEVCVADNDIKNILKVYKSQNPGTTRTSLPKVVAFADKEGRGIKTKCLLNTESRKNAKCLKAETVYVYCDQNEIGIGECKNPKFDIKSLKWAYIKGIDCRSLLSNVDINADNIEKIKACYKGGFNYNGNIYTRDGEQEDVCACEVVGSGQSVPEGYFITREMTPREYGLCVNLVTPEICPAIRYYDSSNKYTDDNLILGLTKAEIAERENAGLLKPTDYQQHYWRTIEKVAGFMQSTIFSTNLEHAEFDSTIFCDIPDDKIREFLEEKKLKDSTINVDEILEEKGEKYNEAKKEYDELNNYYNIYCIGGTKVINGECNGYWRWSENNLAIAPQATCTVQQDSQGNKMYEYVLIGKGCERYSCEGIAYDDKDGYIGDEKELSQTESANVFKYSEIDVFSPTQKESDFRTYLIGEEQDPITVDKRGMSNGFASWKKVISGDYASLEIAYDCLTGYSPAGLNYFVKNEGNDNDMIIRTNSGIKIDVNYDSPSELLSTPTTRDNFIKHIVGQNNRFNVLKNRFKLEERPIIKAERYPIRKCNQKGEWMTVNDVYNLSLIDQETIGNNYYYNNYNYENNTSLESLNYWLQLYDFNKILDNKQNNRNTSFDGYCERNVCLAIDPENENIYEKEGIYNKFENNIDTYNRKEEIENGNRYQVWKHSGGASWENVGATRNDSGKINETGTSSDINKNISRIFREKKSSENNMSIKYLKKVQGICRTDYGYYNRGSVFDSENYSGQLENLKISFENETPTNKNKIDQRKADFGANKDNGTRPERVCTSYGVWGPVFNRCFRGCEMLDIYHTNFTNEFSNKIELNRTKKVGERWKNYEENKYFYIENNDIESTNIAALDDSFDGEMDIRFKSFGLDISPDHTISIKESNKGLSIGDYITGGARWPRTIVNEISDIERDTNSNKYGLRYIEVKGECDSTFTTENDERVRSFMARGRDSNGNTIFPMRRCYEDGSWSQVYENTRCVLQKTCKNFNFTLYDLMLLINIYEDSNYDSYKNDTYSSYNDENYRNELINKLNETLSRTISYGYYPPNTDIMENKSCIGCNSTTIKNCCIYEFKTNNGVGGDALSYESNNAIDNKGFKSTGSDNGDSVEGKLICNMTGDIGEKLTGWTFGITDIGDYFVPNTCDEGLKDKVTNPDYVDNISLLVHHIDKDRNFVPVIYNFNNDTRKLDNNIRGSSILHYAEESKLHYLYNNITKNFIRTYYPKATNIENESLKDVKIGSKYYKSYQMYYRCNEDYFYNYLNAGDGGNIAKGKDIAYYYNDIILECKKDGNNGYKFKPNDMSELSKDEPGAGTPLHPNNCYVRNCGNNNYHQHWSLSYPVEFFEKFDNTDNIYNSIKFIGGTSTGISSKSYMSCPKIDAEGKVDNENGTIETAFILNDDLAKIEDYIKYYGQDKADAEKYKEKGFVTEISADCKNRIESETENRTTINGMTASTITTGGRSYDIQKYGELDKNNLPYKFCRDLNRGESECKTFTESQVAGGIVPKPNGSSAEGNNVFLNNIKDEGGYCVPMACKGKGLKFEDGKILECTDAEKAAKENNKCFDLKKSYYNFEKIVVIQNLANDFSSNGSIIDKNSINSKNIEDIFTINSKNSDYKLNRICDADQATNATVYNSDIYTASSTPVYDFSTYLSEKTDEKEVSEVSEIIECFDKLEDPDDSISTGSKSGYTEIETNLYVKYKADNYSTKGIITKLLNAKNDFSFSINDENKNTVNAAIGEGAIKAINNNPDYATIKEEFITNKVDEKLKTDAREEANKVNLTTNNNTCYCYHENDSDANTKAGGVAVSTTESDKATKYKEYSGNSSVTFYSKSGDASFTGIKTTTTCQTTVERDKTDGTSGKENVNVSGFKVCDVGVYNTSFKNYYNNNRTSITTSIENELKTTIIDKTEGELLDIYNIQYNIYKMKIFLENLTGEKLQYVDDDGNTKETDETYLDVYNNYLDIKDAGYGVIKLESGKYIFSKKVSNVESISGNKEPEPDEGGLFSGKIYIFDAEDEGKFICKIVIDKDEDQITEILEGDYSNASGNCNITNDDKIEIKNIYETHFKNFFLNNEVQTLLDSYSNESSICKNSYKDFISEKAKHNANNVGNTDTVKPGLYMVMKCTPNGWEVQGKASCKRRCTGPSFLATQINPYNLSLTTSGRYYRLVVENLRYSKTARAFFGGVINSCEFNSSGSTSYGELEVKCDDFTKEDGSTGTTVKTRVISSNKKGSIPSWRKFYKFPAYRKSYHTNYQFSDGGKGDCYKEWKHSSYEFYHCLGGDNGGLDKSPELSNGALSTNGFTRLKAVEMKKYDYNGNCVDGSIDTNFDFYDFIFFFKYLSAIGKKYKNCKY